MFSQSNSQESKQKAVNIQTILSGRFYFILFFVFSQKKLRRNL